LMKDREIDTKNKVGGYGMKDYTLLFIYII